VPLASLIFVLRFLPFGDVSLNICLLNVGCGDSAVVMCIASGVHDIASNYPCIWHGCTVCCCQCLKLSAPSLNVAVTLNSLHVKLITMRRIELVTGQTRCTRLHSDMVKKRAVY